LSFGRNKSPLTTTQTMKTLAALSLAALASLTAIASPASPSQPLFDCKISLEQEEIKIEMSCTSYTLSESANKTTYKFNTPKGTVVVQVIENPARQCPSYVPRRRPQYASVATFYPFPTSKLKSPLTALGSPYHCDQWLDWEGDIGQERGRVKGPIKVSASTWGCPEGYRKSGLGKCSPR
jgi:hypothetical protein